MYDSSTADLIRNTPQLRDLDRDALPNMLAKAFSELVAARVRLRTGERLPGDLDKTRHIARNLARTNEALVASSPEREDRRSAAFVAGTAYQLVYQIDMLTDVDHQRVRLSETAISADVSAMILFLIAESSADAAEVSDRIPTTDQGIQGELLRTLVDLAHGDVRRINQRRIPTTEESVQSPSDALYHLILRAIRSLAFILTGQPTADEPSTILRRAQTLACQPAGAFAGVGRSDPSFSVLDQGAVAIFPGPCHLASLLLPAIDTLRGAAAINVPPPENIDPVCWQKLLVDFSAQRPFLWPNHQDAISRHYLRPGVSSVISFPTGAGKSAVFQLKIGAALIAGQRVVFLAPTHSLVGQTRQDLRRAFPRANVLGEQVEDFGLPEGDVSVTDVLVMTPESCLFLQYIEPNLFDQVGLVVFDECHLVHPRTDTDRRSIDAMLCILNLARLAPHADLLLLSAMMQNTDEIAAWVADLTGRDALAFSMAWKPTRQLRGCVVYDRERIMELKDVLRQGRRGKAKGVPTRIKRQLGAKPYGFFSIEQTWVSRSREDYTYLPLMRDEIELGTNSSWNLTPNAGVLAAALAGAAAKSGIKTLVFSQSIPVAHKISTRVAESLERCQCELTADEVRSLMIAADELGGTEQLYVDVEDGALAVRAAAHHGLLLHEERLLIESLFRRADGLEVLSATSTVGQGMNTPSELVIIAEDSRFDEQTGRRELLEARELLNAAGRAGRAGQAATGVVIVIPGSVVEFNDQEAKIGHRWGRLREIFSQSDQCLVIDDPLTAVLDRIQDRTHPLGDLERYVVSRLYGIGGDEEATDLDRNAIARTFGAFRRRRDEDLDWIESRTEAALELLAGTAVDDPTAEAVRRLSSSLGLPEDVLSALRVDVLDAAPRHGTLTEWQNWMFSWMQERPEHAIRMFRAEDLGQQFGSSFNNIESDSARLQYALPRLNRALELWMAGEPLTVIQSVFGDTAKDVRKSLGARKFVVRLLPTLAHIFSALPRIISEHGEADENLQDAAPGVVFLARCIRLGFSSLEMYALYEHLRLDSPSRREVHRQFEALNPYLGSLPTEAAWPDLKKHVAKAYDRVNLR